MKYVEHIGIAVKDLSVSVSVFEKLLNTKVYKTELIDSQKVTTAFLKCGETKIELLQSIAEEGIIQKFIQYKGEGLHHIAFEVDNLEDEIHRLTAEGFTVLNEPQLGADNKRICFLHPKTTNGILVELCESIKTQL